MVQSGGRSERRIDELESGIERLRNQQEMLKRKLKKQAERKMKLEVFITIRAVACLHVCIIGIKVYIYCIRIQ